MLLQSCAGITIEPMWRAGDSRWKSMRQASFSPKKWAIACS